MEAKNYKFTQSVSNQNGIVGYWEHLNKFTINCSIPDTYDSQITFFVNKLPEEFKKSGLKVRFSGVYGKTYELPSPSIGGQEIFLLELTEIYEAKD